MDTSFTQIQNAVIRTRKLSPQAKCIYNEILSYCGKQKDGTPFYPWLSLEAIGKMIGTVRHSSIRKYVDELIDNKLITTRNKQTNTGRPIQAYIPLQLSNQTLNWLLTKEEVIQQNVEEVIQQNVEELDYDKEMIKKALLIEEQLKKLKEEGYW
jgi:hypothetical protein